jgi:hypothetical protein
MLYFLAGLFWYYWSGQSIHCLLSKTVESDVAPAKFLTSVVRYQAMRCIDRLRLGEELNCIHNGGLCD